MQIHVFRLVMESRGETPQVRSLSTQQYWSKLYRADRYFLDVSCKTMAGEHHIQGQIFAETGDDIADGQLHLCNSKQNISTFKLNGFGEFKIQISEPGCYQLEIALPETSLQLPGFMLQ
jgi:hypothetical protein